MLTNSWVSLANLHYLTSYNTDCWNERKELGINFKHFLLSFGQVHRIFQEKYEGINQKYKHGKLQLKALS